MERLNYQEIVQKILESHVKNRSNSQTEVKLLFDTERVGLYPAIGIAIKL